MPRPESEKVDIKCTSCGRTVKTPRSMLGKIASCPGCKAELLLIADEQIGDWMQPIEATELPPPAPAWTPQPEPNRPSHREPARREPSESKRPSFLDMGFESYWSISLASAAWLFAILLVVIAVVLPPLLYVLHSMIDTKPQPIGPLIAPYLVTAACTMFGALALRVMLEAVVVLFRISKTLDRIERQQ